MKNTTGFRDPIVPFLAGFGGGAVSLVDPIVERIEQTVADRLSRATVANGYAVDLFPLRPGRDGVQGTTDGLAVVTLADESGIAEMVEGGDLVAWSQSLSVSIFVAADGVPVDQAANQAAAAAEYAIANELVAPGSDWSQFGGLAQAAELVATEIEFADQAAIVTLVYEIQFRTPANNPYEVE